MKNIILAAYILFLPFQMMIPGAQILNNLNLFLIVLGFIFISQRQEKFENPKFHKPLLLFLLVWTFSFIYTLFTSNEFLMVEAMREFKRLITLVIGYFVIVRCLEKKENIWFLFYVFLLSVVLVGLHTWRNGVLAGPNFSDFKRSSGPFGQGFEGSDIAGGFLATFMPFLFSFFIFTKNKIFMAGAGIGFIIALCGLLTTYSRGSFIALGIGIIAIGLVALPYLLKHSKFTATMVIVFFIIIGLSWQVWMPQSIVNRFEKTVVRSDYPGEETLDSSSQGRVELWQEGIDLFWENPLFGQGFKKPQLIIGKDTHNSFILIGTEMGILGLLFFFLFLGNVLKEAIVVANSEFAAIGFGFVGCIFSFLVVNMFYSNFFRDTVVGSFWIILGILAFSRKFVITTVANK